MSLHPFPPRSELPPPVPPKPWNLPQLNCNVTHIRSSSVQSAFDHTEMKGHKRTMPSLSKVTSFDSMRDLRGISPKRREMSSPSQRRSPAKCAPSPCPQTPPSMAFTPTSPQTTSRLANAKQRAKDVWKSRRQGSKSDIDTTITTPPPYPRQRCFDSPTIPEMFQEGDKPEITGWRHVVFGDAMVSVNSAESEQRIAGFLSKASQSQDHTPSSRSGSPSQHITSPRPCSSASNVPGLSSTIPGAVRALQSPPPFLEKQNFTPLPVQPEQMFRPRSDSLPVHARPLPPIVVDQPARPGSADSATVKPLNIPEKASNSSRHKRKKSSISGAIPKGFRPSEVNKQMEKAEFLCLREQAGETAANFGVLSQRAFNTLSRDLSQLDSRIEYLRNTRASLRAGRRTLHTRIITFLRSTRSVAFSQESLLKQEEALSDLDTAIEEWENKLEEAEKKRNLLKETLLQHFAATLAVKSPQMKRDTQGYTPPATPDNERISTSSSRYGRDLESITIYASLADVTQEIERIVTCGS